MAESNGYIRWRDLSQVEDKLRGEYRAECEKLAADTKERFDSAHEYYSNAVSDQMEVVGDIDSRLDNVESTLDEQSGAWQLTKFLIGSNLALTIVGVLTLLVLFSTT